MRAADACSAAAALRARDAPGVGRRLGLAIERKRRRAEVAMATLADVERSRSATPGSAGVQAVLISAGGREVRVDFCGGLEPGPQYGVQEVRVGFYIIVGRGSLVR